MTALFNNEVFRIAAVLCIFIVLLGIAVIAIELDHKHKLIKIERQKQLDKAGAQLLLRTLKEDEALGQMLLDQIEEYQHDFDEPR